MKLYIYMYIDIWRKYSLSINIIICTINCNNIEKFEFIYFIISLIVKEVLVEIFYFSINKIIKKFIHSDFSMLFFNNVNKIFREIFYCTYF